MTTGVWVIAAVSVIALLHFGRVFFVPLVLGILMSYTLRPLVDALAAIAVPRALGAALVVSCVVLAAATTVVSLQDDALAVVEKLPQASRTVKDAVKRMGQGGGGPLARVREAAQELEAAAAAAATSGSAVRERPVPVPAPQSTSLVPAFFGVLNAQLIATLSVLAYLGTATVIAFFVLSGGDTFRRALMHTIGPSLGPKRQTIHVLVEIQSQLQRYMLSLVTSNALVAVLIWGWFAWFRIEQAPFWALIAALLHIVPYVGTTMIALCAVVLGLAQLGNIGDAVWLGFGAFVIAGGIGLFATAWMQGRACSIDPAAAIVSMSAFGALWGGWGLLLAIPLLAVVKTVGDHLQHGEHWVRWLGPLPPTSAHHGGQSASQVDTPALSERM